MRTTSSKKYYPPSVIVAFLITLIAFFAQIGSATPIIVNVVETGGDNEVTDTVTAKWTGVTYVGGIANEPVPGAAAGAPYTVRPFATWPSPAYVDRNHRHTNAAPAALPSYLVGGEYIMSGNDNRDNNPYTLDVTVGAPVDVYLLIDNRLGDASAANPPTFDATHMQWVITDGYVPVKTGVNRASDINLPDETGIDEGADGTINNYFSVYKKSFPAGTFQLKQGDNVGQNMYGAVVVPIKGQFTATSFFGYSGDPGFSITNGVDSYTVVGGGQDIWDQVDEGTFLWREITGDFDIKVRVESLEAKAQWTKAGIMARESLTPSSRMLWERITPRPASDCAGGGNGQNDVHLSYRKGPNRADGQHEDGGGNPWADAAGTPLNNWIRLQRQGDVVNGYYGPDGVTWTQSGSQDTTTWAATTPSWPGGALSKTLLVGLSVSRHSGACPTAKCEFRNYMLTYGSFGGPFAVHSASSLGCPINIRVRFTHPYGAGALVIGNYSVDNGIFVNGVTPGPTPDTVDLLVDAMVEGTPYTVTATGMQDTGGNPLTPDPSSATFVHAEGFELRNIHLASFKIAGANIAPLVASSAYKLDKPDARYGNTLFEDTHPDTGSQEDENYSARIVGVINVLADGNYKFACSSDDFGLLYLSSNDQPASKVLIAKEAAWNGHRKYGTCDRRTCSAGPGTGDNVSSPQALLAGSKHYFEYIYAEGGGGNNGSAAWDAGSGAAFVDDQLPMGSGDFVPSRYAYGTIFYTLGAAMVVSSPANLTVAQGSSASFTIAVDGTPPYQIQWTKNGQPIFGANSSTYTVSSAAAGDNGAVFAATVTNAWGGAASGPATLTVLLNPLALSASSFGNCHRAYVTWNKPMNLNGTYTVSCSNTITTVVTPLTVGTPVYGTNQNIVCLPISPDLEPDITVYTVTVTGATSQDALSQIPNPAVLTFIHGQEFPKFRLAYKKYNGVGNGNLANFLSSSKYINDLPDVRLFDPTAFFETPTNVDDNYGVSLAGYAVAPVEGDYRIWMSSDDNGGTFIATDAIPAHKQQINYEPAWGQVRGWADAGHDNNDNRGTSVPVPGGVQPVNSSAPIHLLAGQVVYLEGLFSEGGGGDNYAAAVTVSPGPAGGPDPGAPANGSDPIPASFFLEFRRTPSGQTFKTLCDVFVSTQPTCKTNYEGLSVTFTADVDGTPPYSLQWKSNGVAIPGATGLSYTTAPLHASNSGDLYTLMVNNSFSVATSSAGCVGVLPNPKLLSCTTKNDPNHIYLKFNKAVNAGTSANFSIDGGGLIFVNDPVVYGADHTELILNTDPIPAASAHVLHITGITDEATGTSVIDPDPTDCPFLQGPAGRLCADFNDGLLPAGTVSSGTVPPAVSGGVLHLTDNGVTGNANYWTIPFGGTARLNCFNAHWKQLLNGPIGNAADGMSFSVGKDIGLPGTPEEGTTTGLSVTVDTFDNGGGESGIEVRYNGARLAFTQIGGGGNGPAALERNVFVDAVMNVTPSGFFSFNYDTFAVSAQIPGWTGFDANGAVFAARTGGAAEDCWIDDVCVNDAELGMVSTLVLPASQTVPELTTATFTSVTAGSPCISYQWYRNNVAILGATGPSYTTPVLHCPGDTGPATYKLVVNNEFSTANASATLSVACDTTAPVLLSALRNSLLFTKVTVKFSESLDIVSSQAAANYSINGIAITSANLMPDGKTVMLTTASIPNGGCYFLTVNNVKDASLNNTIPANSRVTIQVLGAYTPLPSGGGNYTAVIEAEDFDSDNSPQRGITWLFDTAKPGYSGRGYVVASPDIGVNAGNGPVLNPALHMDFGVNFPTAGNYYFLVRGATGDTGGGGNSLHIGLDGAAPNANENNRIDNSINDWGAACVNAPLDWGWVYRSSVTGAASFINVPSAGQHTFSIWFREDGLKVDQFILTTDATLVRASCDPISASTVRSGTGPQLRVSRTLTGAVLVEWDSAACRLQCATTLANDPNLTAWGPPVGGTLAPTSYTTVTNPTGNRFYRLIAP